MLRKYKSLKVATAQDIRELDSRATSIYGIPEIILMEHAAMAVQKSLCMHWEKDFDEVLILCGSGNNGGDGLALARILNAAGMAVHVFITGSVDKLHSSSLQNYCMAEKSGIVISHCRNPEGRREFGKALSDSGKERVIVDAMLGTGLARDVGSFLSDIIQSVNVSPWPVLAVDVPSGICPDTGALRGTAVRADATISLSLLKRGNLLFPGVEYHGCLYYSSIGLPPAVSSGMDIPLELNTVPCLGAQPADGHKGNCGRIFFVGGSSAYRGAPVFAARAAFLSGCGYVTMAVPDVVADVLVSAIPESVILDTGCKSMLDVEAVPMILKESEKADVVILGPGLSEAPGAAALALRIIAEVPTALVVDGDALTALAGKHELSRDRDHPTYLTPHPGEMARLLNCSVAEVQADRVEAALRVAREYDSCVVLKGACSVIAEPSGKAWLNLTGNVGMATAGSGDVLAGILGALCCQMEDGTAALRAAVYIHGLAGDQARGRLGSRSVTASGIIDELGRAFQIVAGDEEMNRCWPILVS